MKVGTIQDTTWKRQYCTYVLHFLGRLYPSRPGFTAMLLTTFLQLLHCRVKEMAFDFMADAAMTIPGIFTSLDIW